jgi:hypothetical protein
MPGRPFRPKPQGPEPTSHAKQHGNLGLDQGIGKTVLVTNTTSGKGPRGAGFYVRVL